MTQLNHTALTILAIDDDAEALVRIAGVLEAAGHQCRRALDAQSAQDAVRQVAPDLIVSDINLVGYSGVTICEQLKQQFGLCDVPVMFLSAGQVPDIIRRSHSAGGTYYLRKPFHDAVLLQIIEKVRLACPERSVSRASVAASGPILAAAEQLKPASPRFLARNASALAVQ